MAGGLSTQEGGFSLQDVRSLSRFKEPSESGLMSDLLWSDPQPQKGMLLHICDLNQSSFQLLVLPGKAPSKRGMGFSFGPDYTQK